MPGGGGGMPGGGGGTPGGGMPGGGGGILCPGGSGGAEPLGGGGMLGREGRPGALGPGAWRRSSLSAASFSLSARPLASARLVVFEIVSE